MSNESLDVFVVGRDRMRWRYVAAAIVLLSLLASLTVAAWFVFRGENDDFFGQNGDDDRDTEPAVDDRPLVPGVPAARSRVALARLYNRINSTADGWQTEALSEAAGDQLKKLGKLLVVDGSIDAKRCAPLVTDEFVCGVLRPGDLAEVYSDGSTVVFRPGAELSERPTGAAVGPMPVMVFRKKLQRAKVRIQWPGMGARGRAPPTVKAGPAVRPGSGTNDHTSPPRPRGLGVEITLASFVPGCPAKGRPSATSGSAESIITRMSTIMYAARGGCPSASRPASSTGCERHLEDVLRGRSRPAVIARPRHNAALTAAARRRHRDDVCAGQILPQFRAWVSEFDTAIRGDDKGGVRI